MSTNDRADLMQAIAIGLEYTHSAAASTSRRYGGGAFAEIHGVFDLGGIADHLIDQGWRKVDPAADTRVEYGVHIVNQPHDVALFINESDAQDCAADNKSWLSTSPRVVVTRQVTTGPWREVEQ